MRVAICEDNIQMLNEIERLVLEAFREANTPFNYDLFLSGEKLLSTISTNVENRYQIYLLDIKMDKINGVEVAEYIREHDKKALIIFITNYEEFMSEAFDVAAYHFLTKPFDPNKFKEVLKKALDTLVDGNKLFTYQKNKNFYSLCYSDIQVFESLGRKIIIHTDAGEHTYNGALKNITAILPSIFVKTSVAHIINMEYVESYESNNLRMLCGLEVTISRGYITTFSRKYRDFVADRMK